MVATLPSAATCQVTHADRTSTRSLRAGPKWSFRRGFDW